MDCSMGLYVLIIDHYGIICIDNLPFWMDCSMGLYVLIIDHSDEIALYVIICFDNWPYDSEWIALWDYMYL